MFDLDEIEDIFTALAKELKQGGIPLKELIRQQHPNYKEEEENVIFEEDLENKSFFPKAGPREPDPFKGYEPSVIDFLQRCKTEEEGIEIIIFLVKRGELPEEEGQKLIQQLKEKGIRSFGPLRKSGYYYKEALRRKFHIKTDENSNNTLATNKKE